MSKWILPFKCRLDIGKVLLRDNPNQGEVIVKWVLSQQDHSLGRTEQ